MITTRKATVHTVLHNTGARSVYGGADSLALARRDMRTGSALIRQTIRGVYITIGALRLEVEWISKEQIG